MTFKVKDGILVSGVLFVDSATNVTIVSTASSTSTTTGALVVAGGVAIGGDLFANRIFTNGQIVGALSNTSTSIDGGAAGSIPIQSSTGTTAFISISQTSGYVLQSFETTATWVNTATLLVGTAENAVTSTY